MKKLQLVMVCLFVGFVFPVLAQDEIQNRTSQENVIAVGQFSQGTIEKWEPKILKNQTGYKIVRLDKNFVLEAVSRQAASGLIREIRVDLEKTPYLNWTWRIENQLAGDFDEKTKPGDDYAARIYVVVSGGIFIWNTKAMNYVWAKHSPKFDRWSNAFAPDHAKMMALRSSSDLTGTWYAEKRNVREDFKASFGKDIRFVDAIVLMSDTDNTLNQVTAHYGDIWFSEQ